MNKSKKISDEQFLSLLRENAGLYARTARAIKKQFGIEYSRQAVRDRAMNFPEELADIEEENLDVAEEGLHSLMRSQAETVKLRAIELFLKTKGKRRGYIESQHHDHTTDGKSMQIPVISFEWPPKNE
jgi:hypothetical protein